MSNIIPFTASSQAPAHLAEMFGDSNIAQKLSINQLSVKGKVWRRVVDGEETQLTRVNADGDTEPTQIVSLIVLDQNRKRSRAYYPGGFEEGKNAAPTCFSSEGDVPDSDVTEPCAKTCAACPNSVKGSKVTDAGKPIMACSQFKRIAVVPTSGVSTHPVLLLKLAQTSIWDKENGENEAKGWYAFDQFIDMLRARGAKHTATVETKVKFDLRMAYPKLLFSAARWLNPEEAMAAKARLESDAGTINLILKGSAAHDGVTGTPASDYVGPKAEAAAPAPKDDGTAAAKKAADAEAAAKAKAKAEKVAKAKAAAEAAARAAAEAEAEDEGDGFSNAVTDAPIKRETVKGEAPAAASTPTAKVAVVEGTPAGLQDLLAGWDD